MKKNSNNIEAPEKYWQLTDDQRKKMLNECGPDGFLSVMIPNHLLGLDISQECNIHDLMFIEAKNQEDYLVADEVFLQNMNRKIEANSKSFVGRFFRKILAKIYYAAVRAYSKILGKK